MTLEVEELANNRYKINGTIVYANCIEVATQRYIRRTVPGCHSGTLSDEERYLLWEKYKGVLNDH